MTGPHAHDPTMNITSADQALVLAEWLLRRASLPGPDGQETVTGLWRSVTAIPLAAILYAVSSACPAGGGGLHKALLIASQPEPGPEGAQDNWLSTADLCAPTYLADRLRAAATMPQRQRNSIREGILDALDVLADANNRRDHIPALLPDS
ncbi:hypothetical protein [Mycobacteroides abscessus]|uniref:hypothetical protein n=1 Tax=Mycobacteroides abscessus TaxID=36809 RepID=UPI0009CB1248|nr:hypothetical protein [Mycobacteroides abscessus]SKO15742.1 type IV secretory pathway VirD4 components-like protein [Mycobacteroides abscessus subsp. bolletii]SKX37185.1 type IV secretory pathway VirD4 components-like protein [Mycobacteroides abscessus subsp. bolletii]